MNITLQHLIFWQQHQPMPNWAKQVLKKQYQVVTVLMGEEVELCE